MNLRNKLFLRIGIIGLTIMAVNLITILIIVDVNSYDDELLNHSAPSLIALGQIKALGLGLSEAAFALGLRQSSFGNNSTLVSDELLEYETRKRDIQNWLERYAEIYAADPHDVEGSTTLARLITDLEILAENQSTFNLTTTTIEAFLEQREQYEVAEAEFEIFVDHLIEHEQTEYEQAGAMIRNGADTVVRLSLISLVAVPTISFVLGLRLAASITRPIRELSLAAARLGEGEFDVQVVVVSEDELGVLGRTFNEMVGRLNSTTVSKDYFEAIFHNVPNSLIVVKPDQNIEIVNKQTVVMLGYDEPSDLEGKSYLDVLAQPEFDHNVLDDASGYIEVAYLKQDGNQVPVSLRGSIVREQHGELQRIICSAVNISERKRMQQELLKKEKQNIELLKARQLDDFKRRFMSMISHEFRTPLAVINTATHILRRHDGRLTQEKRDEHWERIGEQVKRLSEMMNDVTSIMRGEKAQIPFNPANINLSFVCREIVNDIQATIGAQYQLNYQAEAVDLIYADETLMKRVVTNLLSNAVKYSPQHSEILITLSTMGQEIILEVSDKGIGIPAAEQKYLFQPYFRASNVENLIQGTGLGLRIVHDAVKLHGGRVEVKSQIDQGTTIRVFLPHIPQDDLLDTSESLAVEDEYEEIRGVLGMGEAEPPPQPSPVHGGGRQDSPAKW